MSSSTRLLVLGVVRIFQPVHGYDVRRELLQWHANDWANVAPGSIYNALKSLTKDGLLEVSGTDAVGGRPERTSYKLTSEGEKEYHSLLRETWWRIAEPLDPLMPGIPFMWSMRRVELIEAIKHRIQHIRGKLTADRFTIEHYDDPNSRDQVREMIKLSSARVGAEIAWAEALLAKLETGGYTFEGERASPDVAKHAAPGAKAAAAQASRAARVARVARKKRRPKNAG